MDFNCALLGTGLSRLEEFLTYMAEQEGKLVSSKSTRKAPAASVLSADTLTRITDKASRCSGVPAADHEDDADRNAVRIIAKQAIQLDCKTLERGLSGRRGNVLIPAEDGRQAW